MNIRNLILVLLVFGNILFIFLWLRADSKYANLYASVESSRKTSQFMTLFIEKVLKADKEVSFEDRLKLENDVRELGNEIIFRDWKRFVESATPALAQENLKNFIYTLSSHVVFSD